MHLLILDLDETLIHTMSKIQTNEVYHFTLHIGEQTLYVSERPYLRQFLDYCFANFEIAVWSAGTYDYVMKVCQNIFPNRTLKFIWSREQCVSEVLFDNHEYSILLYKPLIKVWKAYRNIYTKTNTFILDDNPLTYSKNQNNAIPINKY